MDFSSGQFISDRRDQGDRQRRKMTAPGDANSLVVQNLRPGTRYKFRVAAENRHGISPESQAVTTRMLEEGLLSLALDFFALIALYVVTVVRTHKFSSVAKRSLEQGKKFYVSSLSLFSRSTVR